MTPRPEGDWRPLDPKVRTLWLFEAALAAFGWAALGFGLDVLFRELDEDKRLVWPLPFLAMTGIAFALTLVLGLLLVGKKHQNWRWLLRDDDLAVRYGIFWKTWRFVSRPRIQHVDVTAGPVARAMGLRTVSVFVGGNVGATVTIPGLSEGDSERLRQTLVRSAPPVEAPIEEPAGG